MRGIFISYRRDDAEGQAGRLFDDLAAHFGRDAVFMDVAGIKKGLDFRRIIDAHVASCGVLLVIIGKGWLTATDSKGQRRLDDANDFVRLETAAALSRDIPVVPVLVHGADMPTEHDLPDGLKELAYRNGTELTHARWESDVKLLIEDLRPYLDMPAKAPLAPQPAREESSAESSNPRANGRGRSHRSLWAAGAAAMVAAGAAALGYQAWPDDTGEKATSIQAQAAPAEPARRPDTPPATSVAAKPTPAETVERKPEPTAEQIAAAKAAATEAAAARAAAAKAAAARAEAARLELARIEEARRAANEQRQREEAERAAQLAEDQRRRDEEARRLASEQAARDKLAAEQAAGAKLFVDIASAIIGSRQGNRR